jgi:hypothetical protein
MKRKVLKTTILFLITMLIFSSVVSFVEAATVQDTFKGDIYSGAEGARTATQKVLGTILDIVRTVGVGIALIILTYVGIKIMISAPSERASLKQYCMNYVIGAFILIGASGLITIVKSFAEKITVS